ncbi:MAG: hypothetical protein GEEBNDBF_01721 [bacterium]|nr:hypothetical protein [bacterium]
MNARIKLIRVQEPGVVQVELHDPDWKVGQYVRVSVEADDEAPAERAAELELLLDRLANQAQSAGVTEEDGDAALKDVRENQE